MAFRRRGDKARKPKTALAAPGDKSSKTALVGGKRMVITQTVQKDGTVKTTTKAAAVLEVDLQAAQIVALKKHRDYKRRFLVAGDQNAAKRGAKGISDAKRSGMTPGEPDLRVYLENSRLLLIENKEGDGRKDSRSQDQIDRHADLDCLGHPVVTIYAKTEESAAEQAVRAVEEALAGWCEHDKAYEDFRIVADAMERHG